MLGAAAEYRTENKQILCSEIMVGSLITLMQKRSLYFVLMHQEYKPLLVRKLQSVTLLGEQKCTMKCKHKLGFKKVCETGFELHAAAATT